MCTHVPTTHKQSQLGFFRDTDRETSIAFQPDYNTLIFCIPPEETTRTISFLLAPLPLGILITLLLWFRAHPKSGQEKSRFPSFHIFCCISDGCCFFQDGVARARARGSSREEGVQPTAFN